MKSKALFFGAFFLLTLSPTAWGADIFGNWIARIEGIPWMGETVFSFKADGTKLTGAVSDLQGKTAISEGKIKGDEISFVVIGGARGNGLTMVYEGKVGLNEIEFTRAPKDETGRPHTFTAKREFLRHNDYIHRQIIEPGLPPR